MYLFHTHVLNINRVFSQDQFFSYCQSHKNHKFADHKFDMVTPF